MRNFLMAFVLALGVAGTAFAADPVIVPKPVPFSADSQIAGKIKRECHIREQLSDFIAEYAKQKGIAVQFAPSVDAKMPGRVLVVEITDAISEGNAWIGHHKSTTAHGKLYQNGKLVGSFIGKRNSMGGFFAGYKGSCSVLGRTVKALGEDIAGWLAAPSMDAQLGDLR